MFIHIVDVEYVADYKLRLKFNNKKTGIVDLKDELYGEIFEPLHNINYFKTFYLDKISHTVAWRNGADFAPEFLYEKLK